MKEPLTNEFKQEFDLHLDGSRWYGDASLASDWDYVTEYKQSKWEELSLTSGWQSRKINHNYHDKNTLCVIEKGNIQIIFVESLDKRFKVRELAKQLNWNKKKRNSPCNWNNLYSLIS